MSFSSRLRASRPRLWTLDSAIVTYLKRLRDRKISRVATFHHRTPEAELDLPIGGHGKGNGSASHDD
jgi:hypothetical protein